MTAMPANTQPQIDISIEDERWNNILPESEIYAIIDHICATLPLDHDLQGLEGDFEVSITLCDDTFIQKINKEWRDKNKATNVLSFPQFDDIAEETAMLPHGVAAPIGDIFIAYDTVERESIEQDKTMHAHSTHMFIHGFLHLIGYDHIEYDEAEEMENLEIRILERINIANPYETMYTENNVHIKK